MQLNDFYLGSNTGFANTEVKSNVDHTACDLFLWIKKYQPAHLFNWAVYETLKSNDILLIYAEIHACTEEQPNKTNIYPIHMQRWSTK